jgi:hypothetical protein
VEPIVELAVEPIVELTVELRREDDDDDTTKLLLEELVVAFGFSWYMFNPLGPPQISPALFAQTILQRPSVTGADVEGIEFPQ